MSPADLRTLAKAHDDRADWHGVLVAFVGEISPLGLVLCCSAAEHASWAARLRQHAVEIENGTAMGAKVILAGENERRRLCAEIAELRRQQALATS